MPTIRDDTCSMLNIQHITPNSKGWYYSDVSVVVLEKIKGPTHIVEGDYHIRKRPQLPPTGIRQVWTAIIGNVWWLSHANSATTLFSTGKITRTVLMSSNRMFVCMNLIQNKMSVIWYCLKSLVIVAHLRHQYCVCRCSGTARHRTTSKDTVTLFFFNLMDQNISRRSQGGANLWDVKG